MSVSALTIMRWQQPLGLMTALLLSLLALLPARAGLGLDDAQLKAAFIYRFAQFTQWPGQAATEFSYCVVGSPVLREAMASLAQKPHLVSVVRVRSVSEPAQAQGCQVLVLGMSERSELLRWQQALGAEPVLIVGDSAEAFRAGVSIALMVEPNGLAFRINHSEAKRRGLSLSSQMLKLAREVK
ncbi:YfiR family protein [Paucibacter sp. DJ1R-11]|uniref:YfiR family protein n=1 Tax=Paucibacter sp. DJ1R-11 TaxID=2893556 RepID=UPI0021E3CBD3|nr:YfiR family protein [Paucibacter sp. DJ1R-11]MCV2365201.1 YfiR family protein [Paucibacter sp. DJ1R-11]